MTSWKQKVTDVTFFYFFMGVIKVKWKELLDKGRVEFYSVDSKKADFIRFTVYKLLYAVPLKKKNKMKVIFETFTNELGFFDEQGSFYGLMDRFTEPGIAVFVVDMDYNVPYSFMDRKEFISELSAVFRQYEVREVVKTLFSDDYIGMWLDRR